MTRTAAYRTSALFFILTFVFGAIGLGSHAMLAEPLFLITGSLCAVMLVFAVAAPDHAVVPVRVRRNASRR